MFGLSKLHLRNEDKSCFMYCLKIVIIFLHGQTVKKKTLKLLTFK